MHTPYLLGRLLLRFDAKQTDDLAPQNLSAAVRDGKEHLWVASDERGFLERLTAVDPRVYAKHKRFRMADVLDLGGADEEIDLEALSRDGDALWMVGSHSAKRLKPRGKRRKEDLKRLAKIETPENRLLVARVPIVDHAPVKQGAARLPPTEHQGNPSNPLLDALRGDAHLAPFLSSATPIPSKDNGFDLEGLAVKGDDVLFGLRGPVLRGWAVLLMCELTPKGNELTLRARKGRAYRKVFLHLDGLGIRELSVQGDDLLILAGPTMALDGAIRLYRLRDVFALAHDEVVEQGKRLERLFEVPHIEHAERAEGVALFSWFEKHDSILIVYDRPSPDRTPAKDEVFADVFKLPA